MEANRRKTNEINLMTRTIVSGFIHQTETNYNTHPLMPDLPLFIILSFFDNYPIFEYFIVPNEQKSYFKHDKHTKIISHQMHINNSMNNTIYGYVDIFTNINAIYCWSFRILRNNYDWICIGIINKSLSTQNNINYDFCDLECNKNDINNNNNDNSEFYGSDGFDLYCSAKNQHSNISYKTWKYKEWKFDDIIKMEVNTKNKSIKYFINDIEQGIAFKNIKFKGMIFNLAVSFYMDESLQLIDFKCCLI